MSKTVKAAPRAAKRSGAKVNHPLSLRAVYLREGREWISDDFDPVLPGQGLFAQFRIAGHKIEVQQAVENTPEAKPIHSCRITTNFEFRYLDAPPNEQEELSDEGNKHLVAEVSARFTVDYLIGTPEAPPEDMLENWAKSNSLLHCWPYWREFCHATLLRMNLPITMMPMMEVNPTKE